MALALLSMTMFVLLTIAAMCTLRQEMRSDFGTENTRKWMKGGNGADR